MSLDPRGVLRGCCNQPGCTCFGYVRPSAPGGIKCDACSHPPGKHAKTSMTMPVQVQPVSPLSSDSVSSSDDEASPQPVPITTKILAALSLPFRAGAKPQRDQPQQVPPVPRQDAWAVDSVSVPPSQKKQYFDSTGPFCQIPGCGEEVFFDLNTQVESPYCSKHLSLGTSHTEYSPPAALNRMYVTDGHPNPMMSLPSQYATDSFPAPQGQGGWHQASTTTMIHPQQEQMATAFPLATHPSFFHLSQSTPNLQQFQHAPHAHMQPPPANMPPATQNPAPPPVLLPDGVRCIYPLCNRKRFQEPGGKTHEFCGRTHARDYAKLNQGKAAVPPEMQCKTAGCSQRRRAHDDGQGYYDFCGRTCMTGGATVQPDSGEPCSLPGCTRPRYVDPGNGRVHEYCGRTHANEAQKKGIVSQVCTLTVVGAGSQEFTQVQAHFKSQWASGKGACPPITCIIQVTNAQLEKRWKAYQQKLPASFQGIEKYYHGTKLTCDIVNQTTACSDNKCGICGISKFGMYRECIQRNISFQRFGHGFYFAPNSSKCHDYTQGVHTHRAMLLCSILPGKKHSLLVTDTKIRGPPDGCHSVYGKSGKDLNYPELVVYNPDCVMPRYIIVYQLKGVHKIAN